MQQLTFSRSWVLIGFFLVITACNADSKNIKMAEATPAKAPSGNSKVAKVSAEAKRIKLKGLSGKNGMFDVSLEYDDKGVGWLAYSRVQIPKFIETHISKSTDNGRTWKYVGQAGESTEGEITVGGKTVKGTWRDETPCLLFDPGDVPERRWKLFTNRYFAAKPYKPKTRLMSEGTIDVKYAPSPEGPWSAAECVVGKHSNCKISQSAHKSVKDVKMNTEPGAVIDNGVIYLSIDAGTTPSGLGEWKKYRVVLLKSADHGKTWSYVGTLLDSKDASHFGYLVFTGTSLARVGGKLYLLATPSGGMKQKNKGHDGTMVFELTDISRGKIKREKGGKPLVIKRLKVEKGSGGLADFDEQNTNGGVIYSQNWLLGFPQVFRVFQTGGGLHD